MKARKILFLFLIIGIAGFTSCTSNDEPEKQRYTLTDADLNDYLPFADDLETARKERNPYLNPFDGGLFHHLGVINEDGSSHWFNNHIGIYELPGSGGVYVLTIAKKGIKEKSRLGIFNDVDITRFIIRNHSASIEALSEYGHATPDFETDLSDDFNCSNPDLFGEAISTGFENEFDNRTFVCTKYRFPANKTGKPRIFRFVNPELQIVNLGTNEERVIDNSYFMLQYPD